MRDDAEDVRAEELLTDVHPELVRVLTVHCGSRAVAEELAQEALARAWERRRHLVGMASPRGWIFRTALNLSTSRWRRRAAERRAIGRLALVRADDHGRLLDVGAAERLDATQLRRMVAALPPRQRAAVALRHLTGLTVAETAEALGCAEGTVKALTSQGMARLREQIGAAADGDGGRAAPTEEVSDGRP